MINKTLKNKFQIKKTTNHMCEPGNIYIMHKVYLTNNNKQLEKIREFKLM